jgi:MHS family proline/betaine transporter-like MFS transporter
MLAGSAVAAALHMTLSDTEIAAWGWRLPFLGGLVLGLAGWQLRRHLVESPAFQEIVSRDKTVSHPALRAIRQMPLQVFQVGVMVILLGVAIYTLFIWMPTYLTHIVHPPVAHALQINTLAMILLIAMMPLAGAVSDRIGYKSVLVTVLIATAVAVYPLFTWVDTGALVAVVTAQIVFAIINGFLQGPTPIAMAAQFPVEIRYSAMAVGYNVALAIFGGTAPLIATWLIKETGNLAAPAWYIAAMAIVSCVATLSLKGRYDRQDAA